MLGIVSTRLASRRSAVSCDKKFDEKPLVRGVVAQGGGVQGPVRWLPVATDVGLRLFAIRERSAE